jgi:hypothetical protein
VVLSATPALAADHIDWTATPPGSGKVVGNEVHIDGSGTHQLISIADPDVRGDSYTIAGSVRFENVAGVGFLEMWSYFADGRAYYSRTLDVEGPMETLTGDSAGRPFELPFRLNGSDGPERIEVNLVLPEDGTVWIGPLDLIGFGPATDWWTETQSAAIGATGGILAGLSGMVLGILGGRRKGRRLVQGILIGGATVGVLLLIVATVAVVSGQPRHVWYPLGLIGTILTIVDGLLIPTMRRNYQAAELHRIRAFDA